MILPSEIETKGYTKENWVFIHLPIVEKLENVLDYFLFQNWLDIMQYLEFLCADSWSSSCCLSVWLYTIIINVTMNNLLIAYNINSIPCLLVYKLQSLYTSQNFLPVKKRYTPMLKLQNFHSCCCDDVIQCSSPRILLFFALAYKLFI